MVIALPQGQTSLTEAPNYGGAGGSQQAANYYAAQYFQQLFGRLPSQEELTQYAPYFMGADPNIANVAGGDQAISAYANQLEQVANAPQQEAQALQQQIPLVQNLINSQTQATAQDISNPNSPTYQALSGNLNNLGITPSSGAFQAGLGGALGQAASQDISSALGQVGLPIASGYSQGAMTPFNQAMEQPGQLFQNNLQLQNLLQEISALPQDNQGSGIIGNIIGGGLTGAASGGLHGGGWGGALAGGAAGAGAGAAKSSSTWICTELCNRGLLSREEVDRIHNHLFKAKWKRPLKFLSYFLFGKFLVYLANSVGTHWGTWKPEFYDLVMEESDPVKAVEIYEESFWNLYRNVKKRKVVSYGF